ncbi:MAG: anaerobic ribonucleoside-triphosphate reductase activating protein [Clostridia bacterium]|nr:anaerobic ribonucleoside-triphosphate reductase activating protein [Clostridia bacterium]
MNIQGLNKVTLLDYPGHVACTVFTGGCDYRCPFCHNSQLVLQPAFSPIDEEEVFKLLSKRKGILDGVAITGGEPLLQKDVAQFCERVKAMGFAVKLDTNGNHPDVLKELLDRGLVDYVAMDIKNSPEKYAATVGIPGFTAENVLRSLELLRASGTDFELRTTAVKEFHDADSFRGIGEMIKGTKSYFIQNFVDSGAVIKDGLHGFEAEELEGFAEIVRPYVGSVAVRGV